MFKNGGPFYRTVDTMTNSLDLLGNKKAAAFFTILFSCLIILSAIMGNINGWVNNLFYIELPALETFFQLHLKPISLFVYSLIGFMVSILLLLRDSFAKISDSSKLTLALLALIPESIFSFEVLWHFFFWAQKGLGDYVFSIMTTKLMIGLVFTFIGLQIILLSSLNRGN